MKFKQIVDISSPLAYWSGESYNLSNVFDAYNTITLVASGGATLGEAGTDNLNFSNRSINLKNGTVTVADGNFLVSQIASRRLTISFLLRVDATTISGFTPVVGRWSPTQEFAIAFENGSLVAKVQTSGGLVSVIYPHDEIIYNNRFNTITFEISTTDITLTVNGIDFSVPNISPIIPNSNTLFTLGSTITENVYVSDIAITELVGSGFRQGAYILTHSHHAMMLDAAPAYYYPVGAVVDPTKPIVNRGSVIGADAYLVYDPSGPIPYTYAPQSLNAIRTMRMPANSWLTINQNNLAFNNISIVCRGAFDLPTATASHPFRIADLSNVSGSDNGRLMLKVDGVAGTAYPGWHAYDATGTITSEDTQTYSMSGDISLSGVKLFTVEGGNFNTYFSEYNDFTINETELISSFVWVKTLDLNSNRFWHNTNSDGSIWTEISDFAIFNHILPSEFTKILTFPRFKAHWLLLRDVYPTQDIGIAHGFASTSPQLRFDGIDLYSTTNNHAFVESVNDLNFNRQNQWIGSSYLLDNTSYTRYNTALDITTVQDISINMFVWNRNTTTRFLLFEFQTNLISIYMNSRDGVFSYGDVEFIISGDTTSSFSKKCIDFGFNMLTFIRTGLNLQIWVNAELESEITVASAPVLATSNSDVYLRGGTIYMNSWSVWHNMTITPADIEYMFNGFNDIIQGQCTLSGAPLAAKLLVASPDTGQILKTELSDSTGNFTLRLIKSEENQRINILALAQNDIDSSNVVVHGPYNTTTTYSKYTEEYILQSLSDMILDMEPYAYYKMDDQSGTILTDTSTNLRHGTIVGTVTLNSPGMVDADPSILLDGASGHLSLPSDYLTMSQGFTFETLINFTALNSNARLFDFSAAVLESDGIYLNTINTSGDLNFASRNVLASNGNVTATGAVSVAVWVHIAVRMAPDGTYSIWVSGTKLNESNFTIPNNILRVLNYIGRSTDAANSFLSASVSHTATYDYPLSDEDINKHARRAQGLASSTLRGAITQDSPDIYFTFTRSEQYTDVIKSIVLTQTGALNIQKNSVVFSAGNNYLTTSAYRLEEVGDGWTIELGIKTPSTHTNSTALSEWSEGALAGTYKIQLQDDNKIRAYFGTESTFLESTTLYNTDEWIYIVIKYDGGSVTNLYINGVIEATSAIINHTYNTYNLTIGNASDGTLPTAFDVNTTISDIAYYKRDIGDIRVTEHNTRFVKKKVYQ